MFAELAGLLGGSDMACAINDVNKRFHTSGTIQKDLYQWHDSCLTVLYLKSYPSPKIVSVWLK